MSFPPLLQAAIEDFYGLRIATAIPGPSGATGAETFILTDTRGTKYFAKRVTDPVMQGRLQTGLAIARALADYGLSFIVAPLRGTGGLWFMQGSALIALFPWVDGTLSRDFDPELLGAAVGAIHSATPFLDLQVPVQGQASVYDDFFKQGITAFVLKPVQDETPQGMLRRLILDNDQRLRRYRQIFYDLGAQPIKQMVATHGDMQGNILLSADGGMHLIDWDEAELAPAERDLWFLSNLPGFMRGYTAVRRGFAPEPSALLHGALKAWIEGLAMQATAIIDGRGDALAHLDHLIHRRFSAERLERIDTAIAKFDLE